MFSNIPIKKNRPAEPVSQIWGGGEVTGFYFLIHTGLPDEKCEPPCPAFLLIEKKHGKRHKLHAECEG